MLLDWNIESQKGHIGFFKFKRFNLLYVQACVWLSYKLIITFVMNSQEVGGTPTET